MHKLLPVSLTDLFGLSFLGWGSDMCMMTLTLHDDLQDCAVIWKMPVKAIHAMLLQAVRPHLLMVILSAHVRKGIVGQIVLLTSMSAKKVSVDILVSAV